MLDKCPEEMSSRNMHANSPDQCVEFCQTPFAYFTTSDTAVNNCQCATSITSVGECTQSSLWTESWSLYDVQDVAEYTQDQKNKFEARCNKHCRHEKLTNPSIVGFSYDTGDGTCYCATEDCTGSYSQTDKYKTKTFSTASPDHKSISLKKDGSCACNFDRFSAIIKPSSGKTIVEDEEFTWYEKLHEDEKFAMFNNLAAAVEYAQAERSLAHGFTQAGDYGFVGYGSGSSLIPQAQTEKGEVKWGVSTERSICEQCPDGQYSAKEQLIVSHAK